MASQAQTWATFTDGAIFRRSYGRIPIVSVALLNNAQAEFLGYPAMSHPTSPFVTIEKRVSDRISQIRSITNMSLVGNVIGFFDKNVLASLGQGTVTG
jgi:hypothetical protein